MRDILLTLIVFGSIPYILSRPYIGIYIWSWLGYMNPQTLMWGFAQHIPFSLIVGATIFVAIIISKDKYKFPVNRISVTWLMLVFWVCVTTAFAVNLTGALGELSRFLKIQMAIFCTILLIDSREKLLYLVWVIVGSIGFYSIRGGLFGIVTGLKYRVLGPPHSFIGENNALALAILMTIPLMYYLFTNYKHKYVKMGLLAAIGLSFISVVASYSRGAFLAMSVLLFFLWLNSRHKVIIMAVMLACIVALIPFVPEKWFDRMDTIETYQQDHSAMGRINAWGFAINVANSSPIIGGGMHVFTPELFRIYAPNPDDYHDAHSIYFEMLGEQGYVGLLLFLSIWFLVFLEARKIRKLIKGRSDMQWAGNLVRMVQLGLIAYMTGGAFLGLSYFDLPYHLMAIIVITGVICRKELSIGSESEDQQYISNTR